MRVERVLGFTLLAVFLTGAGILFGQSRKDFDRVVNFTVNLKELNQSLEKGEEARLERGRFLLLNGTISDISPKSSSFYLLADGDLSNPEGFLTRIGKAADPLSAYLNGRLEPKTRELLGQFIAKKVPSGDVLKPLIKELNDILKKDSLFQAEGLEALSVSGALKDTARMELNREEVVYLNRLLLEAVYPQEIRYVQVLCELVAGEWVGLEEVESYRCLIQFSGPESFKVFNRRREQDASPAMIPTNTRVLVVAVALKPVTGNQGIRVWLSEGIYIRRIE